MYSKALYNKVGLITMKKKAYTVAVVGATGVVGREMVSTLLQRNFPIESLYLYASKDSAGMKIEVSGEGYIVEALQEDSFDGIDIALFSAGSSVSKEYAPIAVKSGCVVIDNSSCWRMDPRCPLVVPEVNSEALKNHYGIIANPNCSTIQLVVVLKPLHDAFTLKRVVVSTYQSVSGSGKKAIEELEQQVQALYSMQDMECKEYPYQIAFNVIPHIDVFLEDGYTKEEQKVIDESRKILSLDSLAITATAVRVPVFYGHSEAVSIECSTPCSAMEARAILSCAEGVHVIDNPKETLYPMPIDVAGEDEVHVGRIRNDASVEHGLMLWICGDNLRKGAALNAVQIAESLHSKELIRVPKFIFE